MRVNVYAEELRSITDEHGERVTLVHQQVVPEFRHSAIQILLGDRVIHTDTKNGKDDDTPGIKFWYSNEFERSTLVKIFEKAVEELNQPEARKKQ